MYYAVCKSTGTLIASSADAARCEELAQASGCDNFDVSNVLPGSARRAAVLLDLAVAELQIAAWIADGARSIADSPVPKDES